MNEPFWEDGQPCSHPGCASHISHPCEGCGRTGARGRVLRRSQEKMLGRHEEAPVYVDELFVGHETDWQAKRVGSRNAHRWCHMWSLDLDALHAMASRIGLKREWFQDRKGFPHYDLTPSRRAEALRRGAVEMSLRQWLIRHE